MALSPPCIKHQASLLLRKRHQALVAVNCTSLFLVSVNQSHLLLSLPLASNMALSTLYDYALDNTSTLPSKGSFLKKQVVPATPLDKHYNDKCLFCWDEYSAGHPPAKLLPCGHVFGHTCAHRMVDGPTGDLCPICRTKLFRRDLSPEVMFSLVMDVVVPIFATYKALVNAFVDVAAEEVSPLLPRWLLNILDGPRFWAMSFVRYCTDVASRNPGLHLHQAFVGTSLFDVLRTGCLFAPVLWLVYAHLGFHALRYLWFLTEVATSSASQLEVRFIMANGHFTRPVDRVMVERLVDITLVVKFIIVAVMFRPWSALVHLC